MQERLSRLFVVFGTALIVAVLASVLTARAGTQDKNPDPAAGVPHPAQSTTIACGATAVLTSGSFTTTQVVQPYRVSFTARGWGTLHFFPYPYFHRSEISVLCNQTWTHGHECRYSYTADYIEENLGSKTYEVQYWAQPCDIYPWDSTISNVTVEFLAPDAPR